MKFDGTVPDDSAMHSVRPVTSDIRLEVVDNHRRDSPDAVLRLTLAINHPLFGTWNISLPISRRRQIASDCGEMNP